MTSMRARYSKIQRMVDGLLSGVGPSVPVPVERLVSGYGIEVKRGDLGDVSGLLLREPDGAVIGVNSTQSKVRQRFTIAHEFGHFLLHEGMIEHVDLNYRVNYRSSISSEATSIEEIEANFFAAALLMPKTFLDARGAQNALDDDNMVRALAREFNVSQLAMSLRLANVYRQYVPF